MEPHQKTDGGNHLPKNICLWAGISANLRAIESAICGQREGQVFGQTPLWTRATLTRLQKYSSLPWPNGCDSSGGRWLRRIPNRSRAPLPVSTRECTPSESIAELPLKNAATN